MSSFWQKIKDRWEVKSNIDVALILLAFAITGSTTMKVMKYVEGFVGVTDESPLWLKVLSFLILVLPIYNLLLIIVGSILGQHKFFKKFISNFFRRILLKKKK